MTQLTALLVSSLAATVSGCGMHHILKRQSASNDTLPGPPFSISKVTNTTHLIIQNDKYIEFPYIYVKQYPEIPLSLVIDTGTGSENSKATYGNISIELTDFIRQNLPLDGDHQFMVASSHVHFDHIGGMQAFDEAGAYIVASSFNESFISPENRAANALTTAFGTVTPNYTYDAFLDQGEAVKYQGHDLGLTAYHTPGHTPDSMAIYDEKERHLYIGDTLYARLARMPWGDIWDVPIILPLQGDWKDWVSSIEELLAFVNKKDQGATPEQRVQLSAGHSTSGVVAVDIIQAALDFVRRVEAGSVPVIAKLAGDEVAPGGTLGNAEFWYWQDDGSPQFSLLAPAAFRKDFEKCKPCKK